MRRLPHVHRALSAIAATGRVVIRQPTLLVYPIVLTALVVGLVVAVGAGIYITNGGPVVWTVLYASYFVVGGVLTTFAFGALYYESDAVLREGARPPLIGLLAAWRNRRRLLIVGLVVGTVGLASWAGRPILEGVFGDEAAVILDVIVGTGLLTAIQIAVLGTGDLRDNLDTIEAVTEAVWVESLLTRQVNRGISTVCLWIGAAFGLGSVVTGYRVEPLGFWTPFLGFLLVPVATILLCATIHGVSQAALFQYATGNEDEATVSPSGFVVTERD
ncbi:hypothetical protein ACOZ4N_09465 [Halorientalis pallida]|uniref:hypothetical protein n=1 Tax=Halorientalis pallida TaxID=2479928 RepID=UPI003C702C4F